MKTVHRTAGDTNEHVVHEGRCRVHGIFPEVVTAGTITLRNAATTGGSAILVKCAAALPQAGKKTQGVLFDTGLTVQLSNAADLSAIVWEAVP